MCLPKWPKSILNLYNCQMLVLNTINAILTHENHILDTKNRDSMYHDSKVIAKNRIWWLPMAVILDSEITKMPSGCNHNTHLILKLHGIETPNIARFNHCASGLIGQVSRSDTVPVLRLYLSPVRMRDIKCLNLNSRSVLRLSQCAAATVAWHCFYYHFRVSIAPPLFSYKCINDYLHKEGAWAMETRK